MGKTCSIEGCDRPLAARTWCRPHWKRWRRNGDPVAVVQRPRKRMEDRFFAKVADGAPDECWEWQASRDSLGYGFFRVAVNENMQRSHRVAWVLANGPINEGHLVCHRCDNPPCCNPAHLFLGTDQDNSTDKVREIRERRAAGGVTQIALAREYGISQTEVSRIIRRTRWAPLSA